MRSPIYPILVSIIFLTNSALGQDSADEVCREFGETPSRSVGRQNRLAPYVFGRIAVSGVASTAKPPRVIVIYSDNSQPATRLNITRSGNYCFRRMGNGGLLIVDVDGVEVARRSLSDLGGTRTREDFEILSTQTDQAAPPGVISARYSRSPNERTLDLYKKAAESERNKKTDKAIEYVKEIVAVDPEDFVAWAKLGSLYLEKNMVTDAENSFNKAISIRPDYSPALLNLGIMRAFANQFAEAIEFFKRAVIGDPTSARAYRLLGEAHLQNREGSLGLAALDKALEIDPIGMADCHLLKARLYDLVGAKNVAAGEYRAFLAKVPEHPDKKKFEKYIKDHGEQ